MDALTVSADRAKQYVSMKLRLNSVVRYMNQYAPYTAVSSGYDGLEFPNGDPGPGCGPVRLNHASDQESPLANVNILSL